MFSQALTVPDAIRAVLANNNSYLQALELGIANYTALAERIKPDIEKLIGSKVNLNTVVVAIKRFADSLDEKPDSKPLTTKAKMSLTGSIIDVSFQKENDKDLAAILDEFFERDNRYHLFQTDNHLTLLAEDAEDTRKIVTSALEKFDGKVLEGLSRVSLSLNSEEQSPYYLLSPISTILYNHRISVHSAFLTANEIVLILSNNDAAKAYDLIRMRIE
jgi:hypothetical protein